MHLTIQLRVLRRPTCSQVFRSPLSALLQRPTFDFAFERGAVVDTRLLDRLGRAVAESGVVLAPPAAIKSFLLKFLELCRERAGGGSDTPSARPPASGRPMAWASSLFDRETINTLGGQLRLATRVLRLWRRGALVLDEVRDAMVWVGPGGRGEEGAARQWKGFKKPPSMNVQSRPEKCNGRLLFRWLRSHR